MGVDAKLLLGSVWFFSPHRGPCAMIHPSGCDGVPLTQFEMRVLSLANEFFTTAYRYVFEGYWRNGVFHDMCGSLAATDWRGKTYEFYYPSFRDVEGLKFSRIAVKVLPELDGEVAAAELKALVPPLIRPPGRVDSELRVLIAPRRRGPFFIRAKRLAPGYRTAVIITPVPEIALKRLLAIVLGFIKRRVKALLEKTGKEGLWGHIFKGDHFVARNSLLYIIECFGLSLRNSLACLCHFWNWLAVKLRHVMAEIGRQSMVKMAMRKIAEVKELLSMIKAVPRYVWREEPAVLKRLEEVLAAPCLRRGGSVQIEGG